MQAGNALCDAAYMRIATFMSCIVYLQLSQAANVCMHIARFLIVTLSRLATLSRVWLRDRPAELPQQRCRASAACLPARRVSHALCTSACCLSGPAHPHAHVGTRYLLFACLKECLAWVCCSVIYLCIPVCMPEGHQALGLPRDGGLAASTHGCTAQLC